MSEQQMIVSKGDVLTFDNGMVAAYTASRRLALMNQRGVPAKGNHMPLLSEYNARHTVVRIDTRNSEREDYRCVWKDENFDFKTWTYKDEQASLAA